jgi:eukaryotic-like serine/threonine-protein kinase
VYYYSDRDGNMCLWAQRLEASSRKPMGQAFPVQHFHNTRQSLRDIPRIQLGMALAKNEIVLDISDTTGNIWMAERKKP